MKFNNITIISCIIFLSWVNILDAQIEKDSVKSQNKFAPDLIRVQFAGNAGLVSVGPQWLILKEKVELGLTFGVIPKTQYSKTFYSTTIKAMYSPTWSVDYKSLSWQPVSIGPVVSRYSGLDLSRYKDSDSYPDNYYWWGIKNRFGLALDTEINMKMDKGPFSNISFYLESSLWDVYFMSVYANDNDSYLEFDDIIVMGAGVKLFFRR